MWSPGLSSVLESESEDIKRLVEVYTDYRSDDKLKEIILNIYKFIQSAPFPEEWLNENVDSFKFENINDFSETEFGKVLLTELSEEIEDGVRNIRKIKSKMEIESELDPWVKVLENDIDYLMEVYDASNISWDETFIRLINSIARDLFAL
jgi:ATP-dependent helicase/nuclease subunit A